MDRSSILKVYITMKNDIEAYLMLDGSLTRDVIENLVECNIKSMCFEEQEEQVINEASEILTPAFLNILSTYFEIEDRADFNQYSVVLFGAVSGFLNSLKKQVLKNADNQQVSTGVLLTWASIVKLLDHYAKDINAYKLQIATTRLENEVHKFVVVHLNYTLGKQAGMFKNEASHFYPVHPNKFNDRQRRVNQAIF
jgi:hypothetical protein